MSDELHENIKLSQVYLDPINPRHDPLEAEAEVIAHLLKKEDVKPLARHIALKGRLSPLELVGLVPHPTVSGAYIPAEGNRRMCALKLLADPDRATTEADKKYFRNLQAQMPKPIKSLRAIVFKSKKEARDWVSLRHEGSQGGVGTKGWTTPQQARFNMEGDKATNPNALAMKVLDYAVSRGLVDVEQRSQISVTTLTRYLSNPVFRNALGLENNKDLTTGVDQTEFDRVLKRFLEDALNPDTSGVNSRTDSAARIEYANKLREEGVAPSTRGGEPIDVGLLAKPIKAAATTAATTAASATATDNTKSPAPRRNNKGRDDDKYVIPRSFKATIKKGTILKRVYDELYNLPADDFSFAAAYLTRSVIEQAAAEYLRFRKKNVPHELHAKLLALEKLLQDEGVPDKARKPLRVMGSNKDDRGSAETLGAFVHGGIIPSKHDGIRTWDDVEAALAHVFSNLK